MDGTAITAIRELAEKAAGQTVYVDGTAYSPVPLSDPRKPWPAPEPLALETLNGFVDYLLANRESLQLDKAMIHVEDQARVHLLLPCSGHFQQRFCHARALCYDRMAGFVFGSWLDLETMIITLQSRFVPDAGIAEVLRLLGNVRDEQLATSVDDGVTQQATVRSGIAVVERKDIKNPFQLAPYRTFPEIEQPPSPFILRLRRGPGGLQVALFEADGGAWRLYAVSGIGAYLAERLTQLAQAPVILA